MMSTQKSNPLTYRFRPTLEIRSIQRQINQDRQTHSTMIPGQDIDQRRYDCSSRSIRIWPVHGTSQDQMWIKVDDFIHSILMVIESEMDETKIEDVRRMRSGNNPAHSYQMLDSMTYSMDPEPFRKSSRSQPTRGEKIMMDAQIKANKTGRSQLVRTRRNEYIVDPAEVSVC